MNTEGEIYLDNAATTPVDPEVREAMMPYLCEVFGNPSSAHSHGQRARRALDVAREEVAALINAQSEEIIFTSGGTEACNLALRGHCTANGVASPRLLISAIEHDAVRETAWRLRENGNATLETVGVSSLNLIDQDSYDTCLKSGITLVSIMSANNDVGTIQPISALVSRAKSAGALFHSDAVQAIGKIPIDVTETDVDMMSFSAHKFHGPKGVGALYLKRGTRIAPHLYGGSQESRRRAGTENLAGIVGFGKACALAKSRLETDAIRIAGLRAAFEARISTLHNIPIHGSPSHRLPGILCISICGIPGETLMMAMDIAGVSISTGAACHSESRESSHTLAAMNVAPAVARSMIRISIGRQNTLLEVERAADTLLSTVARLCALGNS